MNPKQIISLVAVLVGIVVLVGVFTGAIGTNDTQNWQILQYPTGTIRVIDGPGWFAKLYGKTWTYSRYMKFTYNDVAGEGDKGGFWILMGSESRLVPQDVVIASRKGVSPIIDRFRCVEFCTSADRFTFIPPFGAQYC